jgi:putative flippase GtrA
MMSPIMLSQLARYGIVGIATNSAMFMSYLALSWFGVGPKLAMSVLYAPGVLLSFLGNRRFTFHHGGAIRGAMARYLATYAFGYVFCFAALAVLVDVLALPPNPVVLALIFITAGMLYLLQRVWVFPPVSNATRSGALAAKQP